MKPKFEIGAIVKLDPDAGLGLWGPFWFWFVQRGDDGLWKPIEDRPTVKVRYDDILLVIDNVQHSGHTGFSCILLAEDRIFILNEGHLKSLNSSDDEAQI